MNYQRSQWLLLFAYGCSGCAGLVYQVTWTRLLTLYMGHSTAAVATVVAAFMGGLGVGAVFGGRMSARIPPRRALLIYASLEIAVALAALCLPQTLDLFTPLLAWAYRDGAPGPLFPVVRLIGCFAVLLVPAMALGATFPLAARWVVRHTGSGREGGALYAANTCGAALGASLAGFILLPRFGMLGTTFVGAGAGLLAALAALSVSKLEPAPSAEAEVPAAATPQPSARSPRRQPRAASALAGRPDDTTLAAIVLGLTGLATFTFEITWARTLSQIFGPTTYAFAATVSLLICGLAVGSSLGAWYGRRTARPSLALCIVLALTAIAGLASMRALGTDLPRRVVLQLASMPLTSGTLLGRHIAQVALLFLPVSVGLGFAFPLALAHVAGDPGRVPRRLGLVFGINTLAAVAGSVAAGFVLIPGLGLQRTLAMSSALLATAGGVALWRSTASRLVWGAGTGLLLGVGTAGWFLPSWDKALLASGVYKPAASTPDGLDIDRALRAGELLFFKDGAASTVAVKRLTGAVSLSIDGKVDASTSGDMVTQRALAHLPLLLHPNPKSALIIGLGSGVTLGSALVHPVERADVVEISPEVVEASAFFGEFNHLPFTDSRSRLILGDGRLHLKLTRSTYDVIVSEPSNPWMSGVAALFTREFFESARARLAPGGVICQWAHAYDISTADLRSIVATFLAVFPHGTLWLLGESDILLVASDAPLDTRLAELAKTWPRPGVAADLAQVGVTSPFELLSLYGGGPRELARFANGAPQQTDDGMELEFSGPRSLSGVAGRENVQALHVLLDTDEAPPAIRDAMANASPADWRNRAAMLAGTLSFEMAFEDYARAAQLDPNDVAALDGFVRTAEVLGRAESAATDVRSWIAAHPDVAALRVAASRLQLILGQPDVAIELALGAVDRQPTEIPPVEHLASLFADFGDADRLAAALERWRDLDPESPRLSYYAAHERFLRGDLEGALPLARQAVERAPGFAQAHNLLGAIRASRGDRESARRHFEDALALDAEDSVTYQNLGLLALEGADPRSAERYFVEALLLNPGSAAARDGLARSQVP